MDKIDWQKIITRCAEDYKSLKDMDGVEIKTPPRDFIRAWMQVRYKIFKLSGFFYRLFNRLIIQENKSRLDTEKLNENLTNAAATTQNDLDKEADIVDITVGQINRLIKSSTTKEKCRYSGILNSSGRFNLLFLKLNRPEGDLFWKSEEEKEACYKEISDSLREKFFDEIADGYKQPPIYFKQWFEEGNQCHLRRIEVYEGNDPDIILEWSVEYTKDFQEKYQDIFRGTFKQFRTKWSEITAVARYYIYDKLYKKYKEGLNENLTQTAATTQNVLKDSEIVTSFDEIKAMVERNGIKNTDDKTIEWWEFFTYGGFHEIRKHEGIFFEPKKGKECVVKSVLYNFLKDTLYVCYCGYGTQSERDPYFDFCEDDYDGKMSLKRFFKLFPKQYLHLAKQMKEYDGTRLNENLTNAAATQQSNTDLTQEIADDVENSDIFFNYIKKRLGNKEFFSTNKENNVGTYFLDYSKRVTARSHENGYWDKKKYQFEIIFPKYRLNKKTKEIQKIFECRIDFIIENDINHHNGEVKMWLHVDCPLDKSVGDFYFIQLVKPNSQYETFSPFHERFGLRYESRCMFLPCSLRTAKLFCDMIEMTYMNIDFIQEKINPYANNKVLEPIWDVLNDLKENVYNISDDSVYHK